MGNQYQYQLDNEYRNRQMAQAENHRLAQETQDKPKRNPFGAVINTVQRMVSNRPQAKSVAHRTDSQTMPAVG